MSGFSCRSAAAWRLGQLHDYVAKTLLNWGKERCQDRPKAGPSLIMEPIANRLTQPQIAAFAGYVNDLE
jgi:hypothetical protein